MQPPDPSTDFAIWLKANGHEWPNLGVNWPAGDAHGAAVFILRCHRLWRASLGDESAAGAVELLVDLGGAVARAASREKTLEQLATEAAMQSVDDGSWSGPRVTDVPKPKTPKPELSAQPAPPLRQRKDRLQRLLRKKRKSPERSARSTGE